MFGVPKSICEAKLLGEDDEQHNDGAFELAKMRVSEACEEDEEETPIATGANYCSKFLMESTC